MAQGTTYKVLSGIQKVPGFMGRGTQFGVEVELTFADGRQVKYWFKRDRKKEVVAALEINQLAQNALAAQLDEENRLSFVWNIGARGMVPAAEG